MKQLKIGFTLLIITFATKAFAYTNVPVQILLDKDKQSDTIGFNLVRDLPDLLYKNIMTGRIKIYDSPAQEVALTPQALRTLEVNTNTTFSNTDKIVINQIWSSNKKRSNFQMVGFTLLNKSPNGTPVSYGFVNAREVYQLLNSVLIPVNINGTYRCTYWEAVLSMRYSYTVIQFGKRNFNTHYNELQEVKMNTFFMGKPVENMVYPPNRKKVSYYILPDYTSKITNSTYLFNGLTQFYKDNLEIYFNSGGDKYSNYLDKNVKVNVTGIKVTEIWLKNGNEKTYVPTEITIFVNNRPLNNFTMDDLTKYNLLFNFRSIEEILRQKEFQFFITDINGIDIPTNDADKYYKALRIYSWSQLTEAVKYY